MILIFKFVNGDYYTTYRNIANAHVKIAPFTRYSGFQHATRQYAWIPVNMLKPLNELVLT